MILIVIVIAFLIFAILAPVALIGVPLAIRAEEKIVKEIEAKVDEALKNPPQNPGALKAELYKRASRLNNQKDYAFKLIDRIKE